ncbi:magnesium-translocating P-type ATPase [Mucilaginibacter sp. L3T2-6]|uniref:magnesium-translocating P-type ATPase n=1 Tax=Mucilaginibacter sp. L3T2-6 TaxID=3062491 RepID=UPI0026756476|nr:magnesium-translocating P-type ATPase [Mucilaginibacter sp. L3T2-6]MDO3642194.1 magnesium-translocating P-type ATPase [Mucilaginibacter sp. L3T2-6]MDV6214689.1 magnesium-translocating P-type ATPase [Mucilaginibacter sp. L3T2-6]
MFATKPVNPPAPFLKNFWNISVDSAIQELQSGTGGLEAGEAAARLRLYGKNTLKSSDKKTGLVLFLAQFKSPVTLLLIIASLISAGLGDATDTAIIFIIVLISGLLGFLQERGAANAINELLKMVQLHCTVLRNSINVTVPAEKVVTGDIICLSAGDVIPADSLVMEAVALFVDEAVFTGETFPVEKAPGLLPEDTPLSKRSNVLLMGSHVVSGTARAIAVNTGWHTELGKISDSLRAKIPETDFERGIRRFGYMLMEITLLLVIIIFALNVYLHKPVLDSFLFSLALAVGLTPQLLPAIIGVNLSAGARHMALKKVIVKRLSSIENVGSMNILCSDKTGTITEGKVKLKSTLDINGGNGSKVMQYAWLNASMQKGFRNPIDDAICEYYSGDAGAYTVRSEIPYDFIRKRLTVVINHGASNIAITKGALNNVLAVCDMAETADGKVANILDHKAHIIRRYEELSNAGYRTLGVAYKITEQDKFERDDENKMVFLGFVTFFDPPKAGVASTIANLRDLGVSLKIITGDNALVAKSLAIQIGMHSPKILTGGELKQMSNAAFKQQAPKTDIFAEVEPNQKEHIIFVLKQTGNVVGFMGDGINDAPALHAADVGISVNTAVDVAKEAADIVLLNQDLDVLSNGIIEGRKTFTNTMKYIFMATSANFGNMFSMAGASLFLPFLPLLPKQILLTNLMTDFPEMAIATDNVDDIAIQKPQRWDLRFIRRFMLTFGLLSSLFDYLTFGLLLLVMHAGEKTFQTGWFIESVISADSIVLVVRTRKPFFKSLPGKYLLTATLVVLSVVLLIPVTPAAQWFGFGRLPAAYYGWTLLIISGYVISAEYAKKWFYKRAKINSHAGRVNSLPPA